MSSRIVSLSATKTILALKEPFITAKRSATVSETVMVSLLTDAGITGVGGATPVTYVTGETVDTVISAVQAAESVLIGRELCDAKMISQDLRVTYPDAATARAGIEIAIVDAMGKTANLPTYELFGGTATTVETDITIPVVPPDHAGELVARAAAKGFRQFKMKASGENIEEDIERVAAIVRSAPRSSLVVDANQGFDPEAAVQFIQRIKQLGARIEIFEQPVDKLDVEGLMYVKKHAGVPVFADESVITAQDATRIASSGAVNGINVKLMKSGFFGALEIADVCRNLGVDLMIGCMLEARVSIAAALHVGCIAKSVTHYDLDADVLLAEGQSGCFVRDGAWIRPTTDPGLGCQSESLTAPE